MAHSADAFLRPGPHFSQPDRAPYHASASAPLNPSALLGTQAGGSKRDRTARSLNALVDPRTNHSQSERAPSNRGARRSRHERTAYNATAPLAQPGSHRSQSERTGSSPSVLLSP
ncbi:hypothetical protein GCM10009565_46930 [Amycolatopsis albidoflavus]